MKIDMLKYQAFCCKNYGSSDQLIFIVHFGSNCNAIYCGSWPHDNIHTLHYLLVTYHSPIYNNCNQADINPGDLPLTQPRGKFLGDAIQILVILDPQHVTVGRLSALPRDSLDLQWIYLLPYGHHIHSYKTVLLNVTLKCFQGIELSGLIIQINYMFPILSDLALLCTLS